MIVQDIVKRAPYHYYCREAYKKGIRPLDKDKSDNPNVKAIIEIAKTYQAENELQRFSHYFMADQYNIQLWTAHLILEYFNPDELMKNCCLDEIRKYSTSPLDQKVAEQEKERLGMYEE
jgi:hypothetical protein